eukprot:Pgem_evm3s6834
MSTSKKTRKQKTTTTTTLLPRSRTITKLKQQQQQQQQQQEIEDDYNKYQSTSEKQIFNRIIKQPLNDNILFKFKDNESDIIFYIGEVLKQINADEQQEVQNQEQQLIQDQLQQQQQQLIQDQLQQQQQQLIQDQQQLPFTEAQQKPTNFLNEPRTHINMKTKEEITENQNKVKTRERKNNRATKLKRKRSNNPQEPSQEPPPQEPSQEQIQQLQDQIQQQQDQIQQLIQDQQQQDQQQQDQIKQDQQQQDQTKQDQQQQDQIKQDQMSEDDNIQPDDYDSIQKRIKMHEIILKELGLLNKIDEAKKANQPPPPPHEFGDDLYNSRKELEEQLGMAKEKKDQERLAREIKNIENDEHVDDFNYHSDDGGEDGGEDITNVQEAKLKQPEATLNPVDKGLLERGLNRFRFSGGRGGRGVSGGNQKSPTSSNIDENVGSKIDMIFKELDGYQKLDDNYQSLKNNYNVVMRNFPSHELKKKRLDIQPNLDHSVESSNKQAERLQVLHLLQNHNKEN